MYRTWQGVPLRNYGQFLFQNMKATIFLFLLISFVANAADSARNELYARVVDVGAGLCVIIKVPAQKEEDQDHYIIYDAGNYKDNGKTALTAVEEIVPHDANIDLLVLSHTDADHLAAVPAILTNYFVSTILHSGIKRYGTTTKTLAHAKKAIQVAADAGETIELNLSKTQFLSGSTFRFGEAFVTMVCGFGEIPEEWQNDLKGNTSELNNAPSIVIRISYFGKSILLCGDAVGRHIADPDNAPVIATEKFMLAQKDVIKIDSDVLVAPHHGTRGASHPEFIREVSPTHVIFSAGHDHNHPQHVTAQRYLDKAIGKMKHMNMYRTDFGDNESSQDPKKREWEYGKESKPDKAGDDDIEIRISKSGAINVRYLDKETQDRHVKLANEISLAE